MNETSAVAGRALVNTISALAESTATTLRGQRLDVTNETADMKKRASP
jgi:hypothetical protein